MPFVLNPFITVHVSYRLILTVKVCGCLFSSMRVIVLD